MPTSPPISPNPLLHIKVKKKGKEKMPTRKSSLKKSQRVKRFLSMSPSLTPAMLRFCLFFPFSFYFPVTHSLYLAMLAIPWSFVASCGYFSCTSNCVLVASA